MQLSYQDQEHLRLLSIFHYILAVVIALFSCIFFIHIFMGILLSSGAMAHGKDAPPPFFGWIFIIIGSMAVLFGWTMAVLVGFAGKFIGQRRRYTYCLVIAGLSCLHAPFGTILGVFTFVVLLRPEVKASFEGQPPLPQYGYPAQSQTPQGPLEQSPPPERM